MSELPFLIPQWPSPLAVRAAMTTRAGGISTGVYASLNLGSGVGDATSAVAENWRRLAAALQLPGRPHRLRQVHGAQVVRLPPGAADTETEADAAWTDQAGVVCVVQAADCLPVLFCDDAGTVVGAAHAGWRGMAAGVLEATVRSLPVAPRTLMAWLGAAIGPAAFEVGSEVRAAFMQHDAESASCFRPAARPDKYMADLYGLARCRLAGVGVTRVFGGEHCTYADARRFFSYRRDGRCGRMAALIWRI